MSIKMDRKTRTLTVYDISAIRAEGAELRALLCEDIREMLSVRTANDGSDEALRMSMDQTTDALRQRDVYRSLVERAASLRGKVPANAELDSLFDACDAVLKKVYF